MTRTVRKNQTPPEAQEQILFVTWVQKQGFKISGSANGGKRNLLEAIKLKRMGVSPGFPDIEIPLPAGKYHGLYIEFKRQKGGKLTSNQIDWLNYLNEKGYYAVVAHGFEEAKEIFLHYLSFMPKAA